MNDLRTLEHFRAVDLEFHLYGARGDHGNGLFLIPSKIDGARLRVIASSEGGWDHVSVSRVNRCPNWEEMSQIRHLFFKPDEYCVQYHAPVEEHVNVHSHTLHLWRPQMTAIPFPPKEFV